MRLAAVGDLDHQIVAQRQRNRGQVGFREVASTCCDHPKNLVRILAGQQRGCHFGRRLQPALLTPCFAVEPRILDGHASGSGQCEHDALVLVVEVAAAHLLGEVQIAEDLLAYSDRHTEKAVHRGMVPWESKRRRVFAQIVQAQRPRLLDQYAENAAPLWQRPDSGVARLVDPDGQEL